jgi:hypothetical protein
VLPVLPVPCYSLPVFCAPLGWAEHLRQLKLYVVSVALSSLSPIGGEGEGEGAPGGERKMSRPLNSYLKALGLSRSGRLLPVAYLVLPCGYNPGQQPMAWQNA